MTVNPVDESKIVVGYGVNDCSAHFVEIGKKSVSELVFEPLDEVSVLES
jgi:hypothetical protein